MPNRTGCCDGAHTCRSAGRRRPPGPQACPDCGYIVERIVDSFREDICYEGELCVWGLPEGLCPPLTLRALDIVCIEPVCAPQPHACQPLPPDRLAVTLCAHVCDSRGCRAQGQARIEISAARPGPVGACGLNIRRGGQVCILRACFCRACTFSVCLTVCVQTILSRHELMGRRPHCPPPPCPDLPLYPPPPRPPRPPQGSYGCGCIC